MPIFKHHRSAIARRVNFAGPFGKKVAIIIQNYFVSGMGGFIPFSVGIIARENGRTAILPPGVFLLLALNLFNCRDNYILDDSVGSISSSSGGEESHDGKHKRWNSLKSRATKLDQTARK